MEVLTKEPGAAVSHYIRKLELPLVYLSPNTKYVPGNINEYLTLVLMCTILLKAHGPPLYHMQLLALRLRPHTTSLQTVAVTR